MFFKQTATQSTIIFVIGIVGKILQTSAVALQKWMALTDGFELRLNVVATSNKCQ